MSGVVFRRWPRAQPAAVASPDLLVVALIAIVATTFGCVSQTPAVVRGAFSLALAFVLPGYALTEALGLAAHSASMRLLLTAGMSVVVVILTGLALNLLPWGLQTLTWSVALGGTTVVSAGIGAVRRRLEQLAAPGTHLVVPTPQQAAMLAAAVLLAGTAVYASGRGAVSQSATRFTALALTSAGPARPNTVLLTVTNNEGSAQMYRLVLVSAGIVVREWPSIGLANRAVWTTRAVLPPIQTAHEEVQLDLDKQANNHEVVYRHVDLWRSR